MINFYVDFMYMYCDSYINIMSTGINSYVRFIMHENREKSY